MKTQCLLAVLVILTSCSGNSSKNEGPAVVTDTIDVAEDAFAGKYYDLSYYMDKTPVDPADVQTIDSTCAIIITPTIAQMEAMEKEYGDEFESVADDAFFYLGSAMEVLDSLKIKRVEAAPVSHLILKGTSGTYTLNIRKRGLPEWNIVFFHTGKTPEIIPAMDLTLDKARTFFSNNR